MKSKMKTPTNKKNKQERIIKIIGFIILYLLFASVGFILGMAYEQRLIAVAVGEALSYTNIKVDVNFNETKFTQEIQDNVIPAFKEAINQTISGEKLK